MAKIKKESLADLLQCASILEDRTFVLYKDLADKTDLPLINSLLLHIAYDSQKHSAIFRGVSASIFESKVRLKDCEKRFGDTWTTIERLRQELARNKRMTKENMSSLVTKLVVLESAFGEEYNILVQLKTLEFMTKEVREAYDVDIGDLKDIFDTIIRDEETHTELLRKMKKILAGEEKKDEEKEKAQIIKYKNPDAWSRPMPGSVYESAL